MAIEPVCQFAQTGVVADPKERRSLGLGHEGAMGRDLLRPRVLGLGEGRERGSGTHGRLITGSRITGEDSSQASFHFGTK